MTTNAPTRPPTPTVPEAPGAAPRWWRRRAVTALAATITATVLLAVLTGWWTPRGPVTPAQALWAITTSLGLGVFAGLLTRSRWAMLAVPALFATTFELVRSGTDGPLVDGLHLSEYGILAFVTGRGFHAVVTLLPIVLGVAVGAGLGRRRDHMAGPHRPRARAGRWIRRAVAATTAIALGVLAYALASPGATAAITDAAGRTLTGSIAELTRVRVGGHDLSMMIRGDSATLPVLLVLAGGPGGTELGAMRHHGQLLEHHFVVVTWDQRGTGRSYDQLDPTSSLTLDDAVSDTVELTRYLITRFAKDQVYLLGQSWGALLGVLAAQREPRLYATFIGSGQMVDPRQTDQFTYRDTVAWANSRHDTSGRHPRRERETTVHSRPRLRGAALARNSGVPLRPHGERRRARDRWAKESSSRNIGLLDKVHDSPASSTRSPSSIPSCSSWTCASPPPVSRVPVYLFQERPRSHEPQPFLADQWFSELRAPHKERATPPPRPSRPMGAARTVSTPS